MSANLTVSQPSVDVLLTHSYHLAHDRKQWRKMQPYPPLGTLYAATALRQSGISIAVFDPMFVDPVAGFTAALQQHKPRLVVIYEDDFNFVTKMCLTHMRELAFRLAALGKDYGCTVIAHGSDASDHPDIFLDAGIDYLLNGEAEHTLAQLCATLLAGDTPSFIPGLQPGSQTPVRPLNNPHWAALPAPARELIDLETYRQAWLSVHGFFSTNVVASRGCPFGCNWCAKPISGNRFHLRAPQAVANELENLKTVAGVDHIWFGDDVFALDRHWIQAFACAVVKHDGKPLPFKIQSRADLLTEPTVAALKLAGCTEVWMGVESGSQKILDSMSKDLVLSAVHTARGLLAAAGIRACFFLQFGYPGEQWPEILETLQLLQQTRPDDVGVSLSYPLPGTVFFERVQQQLGVKRNWADSEDLCAIHTAAYNDEFYRALRAAIHAEVASFSDAVGSENLKSLWARVHALEPTSHNKNLITLPAASFIPIANLVGNSRSA